MNYLKNTLSALISIPSHDGEEQEIATFIAQESKKITKKHRVVIQKYSKAGRNVLLLAKNPKLIIDVHLDTVHPGDTSKWSTSPYKLSERNGRYYGLGSVDVKANIAICLDLIKTHDFTDVSFSFCGSEETDSAGLRHMLESKKLDSKVPVIVMEPTDLKFYAQHKGCLGVKLTLKSNFKGHASVANKKNAIDASLEYLSKLREEFVEITKDQTSNYDERSTFRISSINSSKNKNSTSDFCEIYLDFRTSPKQNMDELYLMLKKLKRGPDVTVEVDYMYFPGFFNSKPIIKARKTSLPFWSHAGLYAENNFSAVVFGPGKIKNAHTFNEYVSIEDLEKAKDMLVKTTGKT